MSVNITKIKSSSGSIDANIADSGTMIELLQSVGFSGTFSLKKFVQSGSNKKLYADTGLSYKPMRAYAVVVSSMTKVAGKDMSHRIVLYDYEKSIRAYRSNSKAMYSNGINVFEFLQYSGGNIRVMFDMDDVDESDLDNIDVSLTICPIESLFGGRSLIVPAISRDMHTFWKKNTTTGKLSVETGSSNNNVQRSYLIPVSYGDTFDVKARMGTLPEPYAGSAIWTVDDDLNVIEDDRVGSIDGEFTVTNSAAKYIAFSTYDSNYELMFSRVSPSTKLFKYRIDKAIQDAKDSMSKISAFSASGMARIFQKVVCCGDSYTSGYIKLGEGAADNTNEKYAWPHYMSLITGNKWLNAGNSGSNVVTWRTDSRGLPLAKTYGKAQAYVIGLGINDESDSDRHIDLGSASDIGTDNDTYYGGMSRIVRELKAISPDAKIFINTLPRRSGDVPSYNEAVRTIASTYHDEYDTFCVDLEADYYDLYTDSKLTQDSINGHYTAYGYEYFAELYMYVLSDFISKNISEFQDVYKIEFDQ